MSSITFEITAILLLILLNGIFAMSELAVVSARRPRLMHRAEEGKKGAATALRLAEHQNDFLSTVQVGITVIGTLASALGGATLAEKIAADIGGYPPLTAYAETIAIGIVVIGISYASLILGELVPKRLALTNPEAFASFLAPIMQWVARLASPVVRFLSFSTNLVLRLIPFKHEGQAAVTEEEIRIMIEQGTEAGTFERAEQEMVDGVFRLADRRAVELMTPRPDIIWLNLQSERWSEAIQEAPYSRFVVGDGTLDKVVGYVHVKDLLGLCLAGKALELRSTVRKVSVVPETMRALKVLDLLESARTHLAVVIDEHGGVSGLITLTDVLRAIIGDVPSTAEEEPPDTAVPREDGSWLIPGLMPVYEFRSLLGIKELDGESEGEFNTVAGFLMRALGRVPVVGDHLESGGFRYEVLEMDRHRIDRVLVSPSDRKDANVST